MASVAPAGAGIIARSPQAQFGAQPLDEPQSTAPRADAGDPPADRVEPAGTAAPDPSATDPLTPDPGEPEPDASDPSSPGAGGSGDDPPGLREQIRATKDSLKRLFEAHIALARAEIGEVVDEVKRIAIFAGMAIAAGLVAGLLLTVGLPLFLGEWLFGSIGWGLLDGLLFLLAIGTAATLLALRIQASRIVTGLLIGAIAGIVVGLVLGLRLTNRGWGLVGDTLLPLASPADRPLAAALLVLPIVGAALFGLLGLLQAARSSGGGDSEGSAIGGAVAGIPIALYVGWLAAFAYSYIARVAWPDLTVAGVGVGGAVVTLVVAAILGHWRVGRTLVTELAIGTILGVALGALSALVIGGRVGAAIGLVAALLVWTAMMGLEVARTGIDGEALMKRFVPQKSMDMMKETIEWARARMPLSRRS